MLQILHNKHVQACAGWLGIVSAIYSVLGWLTPEWFGELTWPQLILAGFTAAVVSSPLLAGAFVGIAYGYRIFRPVPQHEEVESEKAVEIAPAEPQQQIGPEESAFLQQTVLAMQRAPKIKALLTTRFRIVNAVRGIRLLYINTPWKDDTNGVYLSRLTTEIGHLETYLGRMKNALAEDFGMDSTIGDAPSFARNSENAVPGEGDFQGFREPLLHYRRAYSQGHHAIDIVTPILIEEMNKIEASIAPLRAAIEPIEPPQYPLGVPLIPAD